MTDTQSERAAQKPLTELLQDVPTDGRHIYEESPTHSRSIPYGILCHQAAIEIGRLRAALSAESTDDAQWVKRGEGLAEVVACTYHMWHRDRTDANSAAYSLARRNLRAHLRTRPAAQPVEPLCPVHDVGMPCQFCTPGLA